MQSKTIPTIVLGGSGYVAGECLRLLMGHPTFRIDAVAAANTVGQPVAESFPHLSPMADGLNFVGLGEALKAVEAARVMAVFSALPHGESAEVLRDLLAVAQGDVFVVDLSADNRFRSATKYESIYKAAHAAPEVLDRFTCALPDLEDATPDGPVAHPGCFTTCITLATAPLLANGFIEPSIVASAVTGSTGSGRTPKAGTHHPERHGGLWAYELLTHRHAPEMRMLLAPYLQGTEPHLTFLPHSGPFARGIHATICAPLAKSVKADDVIDAINQFYSRTPFVRAGKRMPNVKEVAGTNRCHLGVAVLDGQIAVTSVIDNLVKGASGGAVQWMNRFFGLDEGTGLTLPGLGWT